MNISSAMHINNLYTLQGGDIEVDAHTAKRMRRSSSDALQDMVGGDELSLYGSAANNTESAQVLQN